MRLPARIPTTNTRTLCDACVSPLSSREFFTSHLPECAVRESTVCPWINRHAVTILSETPRDKSDRIACQSLIIQWG
jgi:hypothetical protein